MAAGIALSPKATTSLQAASSIVAPRSLSRELTEAEARGAVLRGNVDLVRAVIEEIAALRSEHVDITEVASAGTGTQITSATAPGIQLTGSQWRPVYMRVHFASSSGTAALAISLDSASGSGYDAELHNEAGLGVGADFFFKIPREDRLAWTFQDGDKLVVDWTNPATVNWGMVWGLVRA